MKKVLIITIVIIAAAGVFAYPIWNKISEEYQESKEYEKFLRYDSVARVLTDIKPWSSQPMLVFETKKVDWMNLAPNLDFLLLSEDNSSIMDASLHKKEIVATFPVPGQYEGSDFSKIAVNNDCLLFPDYGDYYLRTTVGDFKILLLDPSCSKEDQLVEIFTFCAKNMIHSTTDTPFILPHPKARYFRPDLLLPQFFLSDQPLKMVCGYQVLFTSYILRELGYDIEYVALKDAKHIVMQAKAPESDKWIFFDPNYGIMARDKKMKAYLDIHQFARLLHTNPESIEFQNVGNGYNLLPAYNCGYLSSNFAWYPARSSKTLRANLEFYIPYISDLAETYTTNQIDEYFHFHSKKTFSPQH